MMYNMMKYIGLFIILFAGACSPSYEELSKQRQELAVQAQQDKEEIVIGVAWPEDRSGYFIQGAKLAQKEINQAGGVKVTNRCGICQNVSRECGRCQTQGVNCDLCQSLEDRCGDCKRLQVSSGRGWSRRPVELLIPQEAYRNQPNSSIRNASQLLAHNISHYFADRQDVIAVVGHPPSAEAIPASVTYQQYGILFLAPASTVSLLTHPGFGYVFRLIPDNKQMAEQLAGFCAFYQNYKRMVILNIRTLYGEELADSFVESAAKLGIKIVHTSSFFPTTTNFKDILATFKDKQFDAIFLATLADSGGELIKQAREMGVSQPFVGGDALYSDKLSVIAGREIAEGIVVPVIYRDTFGRTQTFINAFKTEYGFKPDQWGAQGYDSIKLLAYAVELSDSAVPSMLATTLRYMRPWIGATGVHAFDQYGEMRGKQFSFSRLHDGKFELIPDAHLPYLYHKIEKSHSLAMEKE